MRYVAGFMFSSTKRQVALINKLRPEWQRGLWNGIGGHIEPGEEPGAAMIREFHEETGVIGGVHWEHFATLITEHNSEVVFFRAFSDRVFAIQQQTDEQVAFFDVDALPKTIPNLAFLVPMALLSGPELPYVLHESRALASPPGGPTMEEDVPVDEWEPVCSACGKTALAHRSRDVQFACPDVNSEVELLREAARGMAPIVSAMAAKVDAASRAPLPAGTPELLSAIAKRVAELVLPLAGKRMELRAEIENDHYLQALLAQRATPSAGGGYAAEAKTAESCDECNGSGVYWLDDKPQLCICIGEHTELAGRIQGALDVVAARRTSPAERTTEPVAWQVLNSRGEVVFWEAREFAFIEQADAEGFAARQNETGWKQLRPFTVRPLYAHPAASARPSVPVAWMIEGEGIGADGVVTVLSKRIADEWAKISAVTVTPLVRADAITVDHEEG